MLQIPEMDPLLDYTDWQRESWAEWFQQHAPPALAASTGPHTDGRFPTIGALVRHIFSAELRYVERIQGAALTDPSPVPTTDPTELFAFGTIARAQLRTLLATHSDPYWDTDIQIPLLNATVRLTPRKILWHVVTHELRHWAQVATMLRQHGWKVPPQDLLFAPVWGEPVRL
jgi:uncharacterized damage-inducible protein DinB